MMTPARTALRSIFSPFLIASFCLSKTDAKTSLRPPRTNLPVFVPPIFLRNHIPRIRGVFIGWIFFATVVGTANSADECITEYYPVAWGGARISNMWTGELCPNKPTPEEACLQVYECGGYSVVEAWKSSYIWGLMYHTDPDGYRYVTCDLVPYWMPPVRDCGAAYCEWFGQIGTQKTLPCPPNTTPDQPVTYSIRLSNDSGSASANQLAEAEPGAAVTTLRAQVFNNNNQNIADAAVELIVDVKPNSGGHRHADNRNTTQMGRLESPQGITTQNGKVLTGTTDASGLAFTFTAPAASGDHTIQAKCTDRNCNQEGPNQLWVGIKNLYPLDSNGPAYTLIEPNADTFHPDNHYLTVNAYLALVDIASQWHTLYRPFGPLLHLNDASLERGGAFDIDRRWGGGMRPRHAEHRRGTVIDIRANITPGAIPESDFLDFTDLVTRNRPAIAEIHCEKNSSGQCNVSTRHFHVRLFSRKE